MGLRQLRKRMHTRQKIARRRYERHRRLNRLAVPGPMDCAVVLDGLKPGYNIGKIFRSADAFGVAEIHLVAIDFFDPAPAMGSFKYVPARFHPDFQSAYTELTARGFRLFALSPGGGASLMGTRLPPHSAFVFGHEEYGFSFSPADYPDMTALHIPQIGRVQSLNVSVAASVILYEYLRQHGEAAVDDG